MFLLPRLPGTNTTYASGRGQGRFFITKKAILLKVILISKFEHATKPTSSEISNANHTNGYYAYESQDETTDRVPSNARHSF